MKICFLFFFIVSYKMIIATTALASYLDLKTIHNDQILTAIKGNGMENGFYFRFTLWEQNLKQIKQPNIVIPAANNQADCQLKTLTSHILQAEDLSSSAGWVDFHIEVSTSVGGDTGGCLLFVYQHGGPNAEIIQIISYEYRTN